ERNLYEYYMSAIYSSPIDIFVVGNMEEKKVVDLVNNAFHVELSENIVYPITKVVDKVNSQNKVEEEMDVAQGKLSLGFRTKVTPRDKDYYSLVVYNGILGGGPHSKLFNNVREKMSLAYYVFSRLEKFKGLMLISSGIEIQNYEKALDEILKQVEQIRQGDISDYEYESTISSSINSIKSLADNALHMTDYYVSQLVGGTDDSFDELIKKISAVTKEDVVSVAQQIELDTIYFLKNKS
ncbi:MAG: M16 family metallopeptidase, partial [Clostridia bacterium]